MEKYFIEPGQILLKYNEIEKTDMDDTVTSIDGVEALEDPNQILSYIKSSKKLSFLKDVFDKHSYEFESEAEARLLYELK